MIRAVIFDLDGVLVDSEPLWHEAEIAIFAQHGVHLTPAECLKTTGLRVDEVVAKRLGKKDMAVSSAIIARVGELISERAKQKPGIEEALKACADKMLVTAVCSSSPMKIIEATLKKLDLFHRFSVICSAETESQGKPHPAVYLATAAKLELSPRDCIAVEDSPNGVKSAKAAGMRCIAVPDQHSVDGADVVIKSLAELKNHLS